MPNAFIGELSFITTVALSKDLTGGSRARHQRRVLAKIICEYEVVEAKVRQFKIDNDHIKPQDIYAQFVFTEYL